MPFYKVYETLMTHIGGRPYRRVLEQLKLIQEEITPLQNRPPILSHPPPYFRDPYWIQDPIRGQPYPPAPSSHAARLRAHASWGDRPRDPLGRVGGSGWAPSGSGRVWHQ